MQLEWKILTELSLNIAGTYEDNHQKTDVFYPANTEQGFKANGRAIVTNAGIKKTLRRSIPDLYQFVERWTSP